MEKKIAVFDKTESLLQSIASDLITFSFLLLCIWFSNDQGGGWWTFFTASMFIVFMAAKMSITANRWTKLKSKKAAIAWANSLPDDEAGAA